MDTFFTKIHLIFSDTNLRRRVFFVLGAFAVFRLGASIPLPGVDQYALAKFLAGNQFFGFLDIFAGGGLSTMSIMMLGVGPYITASIIMQLLTLIFPQLKEMYHEDGEVGRRKIAQYSRLLTVPLAFFQSYGLLALLQSQGVLGQITLFDKLFNVIIATAGSILLMWIGELINEYGIGNGVSLLIFAGILARMPGSVAQLFSTADLTQVPMYLGFLIAMVAIIAGVVMMTEGQRPIPVTYAKRVRGMKVYGGTSTYLPIRVNNAGVMPIIFALSILLFPQMVFRFMAGATNATVKMIADWGLAVMNNGWIYAILYFVFVVVFTYFYSAITFDPESVADNLQKSGAFIPGVRPGRPTALHIAQILYRLTLVGALFLGLIALLPLILRNITGVSALAIGGTSLLIVVSVAIDFVKQIDAQLSMREY